MKTEATKETRSCMKAASDRWIWAVGGLLAVFLSGTSIALGDAGAGERLAGQIVGRPVFPDPLLWVGAQAPEEVETLELLGVIESLKGKATVGEELAALEAYLAGHPESAWSASLRANVAKVYRKRGRFTQALDHWERAWNSARGKEGPYSKAVGDQVLAQWTELLVRLGQEEKMGQVLGEAANRTLDGGPLQQVYNANIEAYGRMLADPGQAHRCGIVALEAVGRELDPSASGLLGLESEVGTRDGLSMADLVEMAERANLRLVAVQWDGQGEAVLPAVAHYRQDHFAAVIQRKGNRCLVVDPAFKQPLWLRLEDILAESSGRWLVPEQNAPAGWRRLTTAEAAQTRGRGYPNAIKDTEDTHSESAGAVGLPTWRVSEPFINLWIQTTLVHYPVAGRLSQALVLAFKQRNTRSTFGIAGFGAGWEHSWLSYIEYDSKYDPGSGYSHILQGTYWPLGGNKAFDDLGITAEYFSQAHMAKHTDSTTPHATYDITFPNASVLYYAWQQDLALGQHRVFLNRFSDPVGRQCYWGYGMTTNNEAFLQTVLDLDGRSTRFLYEVSGSSAVSAVVDPYGRTNRFYYDSNGHLTNLVQPEGLSASLAYDSQGIITNLVTPYGTSRFAYSVNTNAGNVVNRSMEVTEPDGRKHLYVYRDQSTKLSPSSGTELLPFSYPPGEVPDTGALTSTFDNTWMDARNTFSWSPQTYLLLSSGFRSSGDFTQLTLNDYRLGRLKHWLRETNPDVCVTATVSMERAPSPDGSVEGQKIWYDYWDKRGAVGTNYSGQTVTNWYSIGNSPSPKFVAQRMPDGTSAFTYREYNSASYPTRLVNTWTSESGVSTRTNLLFYRGG